MRNVAALLTSPAVHGYIEPVILPNSETLTATGANLTLGALDGEGMYPITTASGVDNFSYVGSSGSISGDWLIELRIVAAANGAFFGADNAAPSARSYAAMDECLFPDAGFGASKLNFVKNGVFGPQNITINAALPIFMERVGTTINIYNAAHWGVKGAAIGTQSAVDGNARRFQFSATVAGQWRVRFIQRPT